MKDQSGIPGLPDKWKLIHCSATNNDLPDHPFSKWKDADILNLLREIALQAQQISELTRKGEELCSTYGNSLIKIHDLEVANATHIHDLSHLQQVNCRLQDMNAALKKPVTDEEIAEASRNDWSTKRLSSGGFDRIIRSREAQPREGAES